MPLGSDHPSFWPLPQPLIRRRTTPGAINCTYPSIIRHSAPGFFPNDDFDSNPPRLASSPENSLSIFRENPPGQQSPPPGGPPPSMNRSLSIRSKKDASSSSSSSAAAKGPPRHRFTMASLRGTQQPELSKKLFKIIKSENHAIGAHETAARERLAIAAQLSDWGEATGDDGVSDVSDKIGVILSELGEQEDGYAQNLEDYRAVLKQIRNTESGVQPSRDHKAKVGDEIQKLRYREPQSTKLVTLEQELVRAEAQNLVAEAQLTNVTRTKLKEAYDLHLAAVIERAEKQIILARHGRRLLNLLDDTPVVPGDVRPAFEHAAAARQVLHEAEEELREWTPSLEAVRSQAESLGSNLMPTAAAAPGPGPGPGHGRGEQARLEAAAEEREEREAREQEESDVTRVAA